ncbi:MAG TPA: adenylate/guanylate cyclase domain-containing protein [Gaiellaceae bacterium]
MAACRTCGHDNPGGAKFCASCGAQQTLACPSCGSPYAQGSRFCVECGTPLADGAQAVAAAPQSESATAERRLVSVLFADLVGFTPFSEARDAEEVRELLSRYFDTCRRLIELYGGTVEKFIGDAVMAVWGTPVATEDDAERAVRAALDLVAAVSALGEEVGAEGLRARAGVLTGEAAVNTSAVGEGMVAGDLVNTAARVQSVAEPGSVFVGDATRRASERAVAYDDAGTFQLKGKETELRLWRAVRVVSGRGGDLRSQGLEPPFVGRDRELRQIKDLFHVSADESRAHLVSVTGIAGIGKSRLAWEFYKYFDGIEQVVYWHRGRCLAYGEGVTYWALADMVRMRCRITEDEEPQAALQKLRAALEEHLLDAEERSFVEPRLAQLLGLGTAETRDRQDLFAAWRLFFERLADAYPTVLAFEDMQWADASLLDFVEYLLEWSRNHPIYVITLARPELLERRPTWGAGHRNFSSLYLEPLSAHAMEALLQGFVPGLPASLRTQILERAEGVPLYAVETVRMLLDRGLVVEDGAAYRLVGEVEALEVPETLHALVAARLDGLSTEERRLLQDAAVLGKTFTRQALAALTAETADALEPLLAGLVRKELLGLQADPRSPEHGQYGFLQDIVRYVAYETLPRRERRAKHLAAADHLVEALAEDEIAEVVASHLLDAYRLDPDAADAADLRGRAHRATLRAADRAASLGASVEARRYFEQAAELAAAPRDEADARARAADMAITAGTPTESWPLFARAVELYEQVGDTHAAARATAGLAYVDQILGRIDDAIERMERSYAAIANDEPDADLAFLLVRLASAYYFAGDLERSATFAERGLDLGEALRLPEVTTRGWTTRGALIETRRPEEARALYELAFSTAMADGLHERASVAASSLSENRMQWDDYARALAYLEQAIDIARRIGSRRNEWFGLSESSHALAMLGRWDEALARLDEIPLEQIGASSTLLSPLSGVLELQLNRGRLDLARELIDRYEEHASSTDVQFQGCYRAALAGIRLTEGNARAALAEAERAYETRAVLGISSQNAKLGLLHALEAAAALGDRAKLEELVATVRELPVGLRPPFLRALLHRFDARLAGDDSAAERELEAAEAVLAASGIVFHLAVVRLEHAEWLEARGREGEAEPLLVEARLTFERLDAVPWLERAEAVSLRGARELTA